MTIAIQEPTYQRTEFAKQNIGTILTNSEDPKKESKNKGLKLLLKKIAVPRMWQGYKVEHDAKNEKVIYRVPSPKGQLAFTAMSAISLEYRLKLIGYYTNARYSHDGNNLVGVFTPNRTVNYLLN